MLNVRRWVGERRSGISLALLGLILITLSAACAGPKDHENRSPAESQHPEPAGSSGAGTSATEAPGVVYGYGKELERPYIFTESEDGNTLYLNGLVYSGPGETPRPEIEVSETVLSQHDLLVRASERSRRAATYEERKTIYADVLRQSSLVDSVREFEQGMYVKWRSSPDEEEIILPREESQFDLEEFQRQLISRFYSTVNSGGMIAFGKNYHITIPPGRVPKTVEDLERIRSGVSPDRLDPKNPALQNRRFLDDLYHEG